MMASHLGGGRTGEGWARHLEDVNRRWGGGRVGRGVQTLRRTGT